MAETQEQLEPVTGLHLWAMGDIITVNKLNAIVNKISENKSTIGNNSDTLEQHTNRLTALESNTTGISYNNDSNSDLTTIDNNVKINGNLNIVSATDNNLVTITRQVGNAAPTNLLQIAPSAMTLSIPATIEGKITVNNAISVEQTQPNNLVTRSVAQSLINTAIGALDSIQTINNDGYHVINGIALIGGKLTKIDTIEIPTATDSQKGLMSEAHVTALDASAQEVSYTPVTMDTDGTIVTDASTTESASSHTIALDTVVTSLANVASKAEVNVLSAEVNELSKDINGDYTDVDPANQIVGLKDIIWGREATGNTSAIIGIIEKMNKLFPLPTNAGDYKLHVEIKDDNPVYTWVSIDNNGGEST